MKNIGIGIVASVLLIGCHATMSDTKNGIERARVESETWPFYSDLRVVRNDPAMASCLADMGDVGGLEYGLCARRIQQDEERREIQLDLQTYLYNPYYQYYGY